MFCDKCSENIDDVPGSVVWIREKKCLCPKCHDWYQRSFDAYRQIFFNAFFNPEKQENITALQTFQPERLNPEDSKE